MYVWACMRPGCWLQLCSISELRPAGVAPALPQEIRDELRDLGYGSDDADSEEEGSGDDDEEDFDEDDSDDYVVAEDDMPSDDCSLDDIDEDDDEVDGDDDGPLDAAISNGAEEEEEDTGSNGSDDAPVRSDADEQGDNGVPADGNAVAQAVPDPVDDTDRDNDGAAGVCNAETAAEICSHAISDLSDEDEEE